MKTPGRVITNSRENRADIQAMTPKELELFTIMRNSMIEIFPYEDKKRKKFYDDTIVLAECFSLRRSADCQKPALLRQHGCSLKKTTRELVNVRACVQH